MKFPQIFTSAALSLTLAAPVAAQAPYSVDFGFQSGGTFDTYEGNFTNPGSGAWFQVFCVNPTLGVTNPDAFDAWVTPFDAADDQYVMNPNGNTWLGNYEEAAQLASLMVGNATTNVWSAAQIIDLQNAIWYAMGFSNGGAINHANWMGVYAGSGLTLIPENWVVITDFNQQKQEFITFVDTPFETVPEPATMTLLATGLAGMAAARRRNKKS